MTKEIADIIEKIYKQRKTELFVSGCQKKLIIIDRLLQRMNDSSLKIQKLPALNEPAEEVIMEYESFQSQKYCVNYTTILKANKLVNVYYLQHEFSVENIDPNRIDATLDGFSDTPYCKSQFRIEELIDSFLSQEGYKRLYISDMEEVIPEIQMPANSLAGRQMTVENALFRDFLGFLHDD